MTIKLLTEHHLKYLSLKMAAQARLSLHLSKCHIVGNHISQLIIGPQREKNLSSGGGGGVANNIGADQPAHPRRLVSAHYV